MSGLTARLERIIREDGPMDVAAFMRTAICHYYSTRDPFGVNGDFITAPEISQMFGEMIGVFLVDAWMKCGSPERFYLAEAGPGRGTLMADILRGTKHVPGFHKAAEIHLIEISYTLRDLQKETLAGYAVTWHETLEDMPADRPVFFVANEFLDALPVRQYVWDGTAWRLRVVGVADGKLAFGVADTVEIQAVAARQAGDILEQSPAREDFVAHLAQRIADKGGVALMIDYGHDQTGFGDTVQAVKAHRYVDVLACPGEADLTAHVDFGRLKEIAAAHCAVSGPIGQGAFLNAMGIGLRAARLGKPEDAHRLTAASEMGDLFRVMALCHDECLPLAGF